MTHTIGMDFGTTNSGVAVYDGRTVQVMKLDPASAGNVMRSVLYLTREGAVHAGEEAIRLYNAQNINRERRLVQERVGRIEMLFAEIGAVATDVHITTDALEPGRLLRSLKSALATSYQGTTIFNKPYTLEELIALYLELVRQRAEQWLDSPVRAVVLGRPVHFVGAESAADDARAEARLAAAAKLAGFDSVQFELEPIAAAKHYALRLTKPQTVLIYDFGGGTLDLTVMRLAPNRQPEVLAIGGVGIAGDKFDQRIVEQALLPHFGSEVTWGQKRLPMPRHLVEQVIHWEGLPALATLQNRQTLHQMQVNCSAPARIYALESLIFNFYGFALFETVEACKRQLSDAQVDVLRFEGRDIDIWQPITRGQFEHYARTEWRRISTAITETVAASGLRPQQIDAVVRTGGSSRIPASVAMLTALFGSEKLVEEDLFTGVTAGLGISAWGQ
jgi:hypothetical chaperone protein